MRLFPIAAFVLLAPTLLACTTRDDDYLLLRGTTGDGAGGPSRLALASASDAEAYYVRHLLANGFGAELLRTYAMTKRFAARTSNYRETPTTIVLGRPDTWANPEQERRVEIGWWRTTIARDAPIISIDDDPARRDRSTMADLVSGLGEAIVDVVAQGSGRPFWQPESLRRGYVTFLQVVSAEWRPPRDTDDRDDMRRLPEFADVHANGAVLRSQGNAQQLANDPLVIASVLYRMASSDLGRRMADPGVYRPFLDARPPRDVHPALLLGAFRNFQAKLLSAWTRAATNRRPDDLVDLIEAYADAYPAERAEVTRIFLVTTYGATALPTAVRADDAPERVASQLAMLTADVLFGRRGLRDGYRFGP